MDSRWRFWIDRGGTFTDIVARRPDALLLCTFSHHGPHSWPDGELVADGPVMVATTVESAEDSVRSQPE